MRRLAPRRPFGRGMLLRDTLGQAVSMPMSRPGRTLLTAVGTVLGVGLLVTSLGLTASAGARINRRFDAFLSTEIHVRATDGHDLSADAVRRARRLNGVLGAGLLRTLPERIVVTGHAGGVSEAEATDSPPVMAASEGALKIMRPRMARGRAFDAIQERRHARVALVGSAAAPMLGLDRRPLPATVYVDGSPFLVEGVIGGVRSTGSALLSVVIPEATAAALLGRSIDGSADLVVVTRLGYADAVATALPAWVAPTDPSRVVVSTPPDPTELRQDVSHDVTSLFSILAAVGLLIGVVGIANTTLVSVLERVPEIGLRRALGARRRQIAVQFLLESLVVGAVGGVLGDALGVISVTAVAVAKGWVPVLPLWVCVVAPATGAATGVLAGAYPALRAARVEPVIALAR